MGVFDFIKTKQAPKVSNVSVNSPRPNANSRGTVTVDKFTFNVRDYSLKGFILEPYDEKILANGPAKLAQAMNITKKQYGVDLTKNSELFITKGIGKPKKVFCSPRIGIRQATENLWNFKINLEN